MKIYVRSAVMNWDGEYEEEYGVLTQDNFSAKYDIIVFDTKRKANAWMNKLMASPTPDVFKKAVKSAKYVWDDALTNKIDGNLYYTDSSGYSDDFITLVNGYKDAILIV